ncbi:MAG: peptidoglycan DD-metalloendopeptidase family protein [Phormidium tanganyikae FI6-MK23]|jgi:muramidase (phage lysozyme)|nr:peptidoglycan DD-metalloendopeptidase family protein [Phormidium tanganyikae FI6-MK23]
MPIDFAALPIIVKLEGFQERWTKQNSIVDLQVVLSQGKGSSTCTVKLADPDGAIANKLITHSLINGGIPQIDTGETLTETTQASPNRAGTGAQDRSLTPQRRAFLDLIAWAEGTYNQPDNGYGTYFGFRQFKNYKDHPDITGEVPYTGVSNASGRYQFMAINPPTWEGIKKKLNLPDFSPASQDKGAIELINEKGALPDIDAGRIQAAIEKTSYVWASFPPFRYPSQGTKSMAECVAYYNQRLATYTNSGGNVPQSSKASAPVTKSINSADETVKGNLLTIQWGDVLFEFFHQKTNFDWTNKLTTIGGVGIRWVLNRRPRNKTFTGKTFREIAASVAKAHGLTLDYQATYDVVYEFVSQDGMSDYKLLHREAERAGLILSEKGRKLVVKSLQNIKDTTIVLQFQQNVISLVTEDAAIDSKTADFGTYTGQSTGSKVDIDPISGKFVQTQQDIDPTKSKDVTGQSAKAPVGKLQPGTESKVQASAQAYKRVRGLPTTVVIPLNDDSLRIEPMQAVRTKGFTEFLDRVWVVDTITHNYASATSTLQMYAPVSVKADLSSRLPSTSAGNLPPGSYMYPVHGFPVTSPVGFRTLNGGKFHAGTDIGCPTGTPVQASGDGKISTCEVQYGYGLIIRIAHPDGFATGYAHLDTAAVRLGQSVKKGQVIATSGNSQGGGSGSTGPHLHWEVFKGSSCLTPKALGLAEPTVGMNTP